MAGLRAAAWPYHQRLERRLDVKARFSTLEGYRQHLEQMLGFCAPLEQRLGAASFSRELPDLDARRKVPLLTEDLLVLGASAHSLADIPRCTGLPSYADAAGVFGSLYVLEGATLGGRTLLPLVRRQLGLSAVRGARFLASYGDQVAPMWSRFGMALEAWCVEQERRAAVAAAAVATFVALENWLCGARP
jgi:heme oxygenase